MVMVAGSVRPLSKDMNWIGISVLKAFGLAWDVKTARIRQPLADEEAA